MATSESAFRFKHESISNNIPETLEEINKEILLQKKKNKLYKLILKSKYILNNDGYISKCFIKQNTPPPTPTRDTNYYNDKFELKKYKLDLHDILMLVFVSVFSSSIVTLIIIESCN